VSVVTTEQIFDALRNCYDPEIPANIVDLGLIYEAEVDEGKVHVKMTLTSPFCPTADQVVEDARRLTATVPGVTQVNVELVWDPPWNPDMMSWLAREQLGML
jgi:FeS assembly SUF system protein